MASSHVFVCATAYSQVSDAAARYTGFSITSPTSDQGVRANDGNVTVHLSLQPVLQSGHNEKDQGYHGETAQGASDPFGQSR